MVAQEKIYKFYSEDLMIRASVAITTNVVAQMCAIQKTFPLASISLGRALTGALLMASQLRDGQRVGLYWNGDGPLGGIFAEANYEAQARGYCNNAQADLPLKNGKLDLSSAVGKGTLNVTRSQPFQKQPHVSIVPIATGEIGEDLAYYLMQSHQIPSIISLAVYLDGDGSILAAGGVLIELMPGATENLISTLESRALQAPPLSQLLMAGKSPQDLLAVYAHTDKLVAVEHEFPITYTCRCSRDRVDRTLTLLGKATLAEMILKGEAVPVTCQFCGRSYAVSVDELRQLATGSQSQSN